MIATEHTSQSPAPERQSAGYGARARPDGDATEEVRRLIDRAGELRLRAPELALVLGQRAASLAESGGSDAYWVHAEGLVVLANIRLGHRAGSVGRAVAALRAAEHAGEDALAVRLRSGLAVCARSAGVPLTGLALLRPALSVSGVPGAQRAVALSQLVGCVAGIAHKPELDKTLAEADRLCSADGTLNADSQLVLRALLRVGMSAHRRRHGDLVGAADAARTGLGFLDRLGDAAADGGVARVRLVLELVTSLLERGETAVALEAAHPVLGKPLRAAEVAPVAWLRLAIATRVHLPSGAGYAATHLLRDAAHDTDRHGMRALSARLGAELAHIEERLDRPTEALETLRKARADERVHARLRGQAYAVLTSEFGTGQRPRLDFAEILAEPQPPVADPAPAQRQSAEQAAAQQPRPAAQQQRRPAEPEPDPAPKPEPASAPAETTAGAAEPAAEAPPATSAPATEPTSSSSDASGGTRRADRTPETGGSVLDRLGISTGSSGRAGGRRRAIEAQPHGDPRASTSEEHSASGDDSPGLQDVDISPGEVGNMSTSRHPEPQASGSPQGEQLRADDQPSAQDPGDWLPRLRLPPSLAPIEELVRGGGESADAGTATGHHAAPDTDPAVAREVAGEEPSADAGLAELLTRALAEHQAGTSSASAIVKRLGSGAESESESRPVNGRHRGDD